MTQSSDSESNRAEIKFQLQHLLAGWPYARADLSLGVFLYNMGAVTIRPALEGSLRGLKKSELEVMLSGIQ